MFWTACHVCKSAVVTPARPFPVVSYSYDLRGHRRARMVRLGVVCSDCDGRRISFDSFEAVIRTKE